VLVAIPLGVLAGAYLLATQRVRRWPLARTGCFLAGVAVLVVALGSGLAGHAEDHLSLHMVQHVLLALVAPPLLLLGRPISLMLRVLPASEARATAGLLRSRPLRLLTQPLVAWSLFSLVLVGTHVPAFYEAALRSEPLHAVEHGAYFWTAVLLWAAVLRAEALPHHVSPLTRVLVLVLAMPPMALIGVALIGWDGVAYPHYADTADQRLAGWIMWIGGGVIVAAATLATGWHALVREEDHQVARDARADVGAGGPA